MDLSTLAKKPRCLNGRTLLDARDSAARGDILDVQLAVEALSNDFYGEVYEVPGANNIFSRVVKLSSDFVAWSNIESYNWAAQESIDQHLIDDIGVTLDRVQALEAHWSTNGETLLVDRLASISNVITVIADAVVPVGPGQDLGSVAKPWSAVHCTDLLSLASISPPQFSSGFRVWGNVIVNGLSAADEISCVGSEGAYFLNGYFKNLLCTNGVKVVDPLTGTFRRALLEGDTTIPAATVPWSGVTGRPTWIASTQAGVALNGFSSTGFTLPYSAVTNQPTIPTVPTWVASAQNTVALTGFSSTGFTLPYSSITSQPANPTVPSWVASTQNTVALTGFSATGFTLPYSSITSQPANPTVPSWVASAQNTVALTGFSSTGFTLPYSSITSQPAIPTLPSWVASAQNTVALTGFSATGFALAWTSLTGRPTALSAFTNDLAPAAASSVPWTGVTGRPTALSALTNDLGTIVNPTWVSALQSGVSLSAFSGTLPYSSLTGTPTIPAATPAWVNAFQGSVNVSAFQNDAAYVGSGTYLAGIATRAPLVHTHAWADITVPTWATKLDYVNTGPYQLPSSPTNLDLTAADSICPSVHDTYNLGQDGLRWRYIYSQEVRCRNMVAIGPPLNAVWLEYSASNVLSINASILPKANVTYDLGSSALRFSNIYGNNIDAGLTIQTTSVLSNYISAKTAGSTVGFLSPVDMGALQIRNLAAPTANNHATTKLYVDGAITSANNAYDVVRQYLFLNSTIIEGAFVKYTSTLSTSIPYNLTLVPEVRIPTLSSITMSSVNMTVYLYHTVSFNCTTATATLTTTPSGTGHTLYNAPSLNISGASIGDQVVVIMWANYSFSGTFHKSTLMRSQFQIASTSPSIHMSIESPINALDILPMVLDDPIVGIF